MVFKDLLEPIGPAVAHRPFDEPFERMLVGHVPARVIGGRIEATMRNLTSARHQFDPERGSIGRNQRLSRFVRACPRNKADEVRPSHTPANYTGISIV